MKALLRMDPGHVQLAHAPACLCRIVAAVYQLPDGLYGVASGVLRGLGMQATLLVVNLGGFWGIGMVLGILLTFKAGLSIMGLWFGLLSGITATGAGISPPESRLLRVSENSQP